MIPRRQQMLSMRSQPMYEERIQSRPMRADPGYNGGMRAWSSEFEPNTMQAAFASSSSVQTHPFTFVLITSHS